MLGGEPKEGVSSPEGTKEATVGMDPRTCDARVQVQGAKMRTTRWEVVGNGRNGYRRAGVAFVRHRQGTRAR